MIVHSEVAGALVPLALVVHGVAITGALPGWALLPLTLLLLARWPGFALGMAAAAFAWATTGTATAFAWATAGTTTATTRTTAWATTATAALALALVAPHHFWSAKETCLDVLVIISFGGADDNVLPLAGDVFRVRFRNGLNLWSDVNWLLFVVRITAEEGRSWDEVALWFGGFWDLTTFVVFWLDEFWALGIVDVISPVITATALALHGATVTSAWLMAVLLTVDLLTLWDLSLWVVVAKGGESICGHFSGRAKPLFFLKMWASH